MSFVELVKYLFTIPGVTLFLSEKLCQEPLKFFLDASDREDEPVIIPLSQSSARTPKPCVL